jgi:hypothetical protein
MQFYDQLVDLYHQLRGSNVSAEIRRRYHPNIQIWEGAEATTVCGFRGCFIDQYMHGYSWVDTSATEISPRFLNNSYVASLPQLLTRNLDQFWGFWFIIHELGKKYNLKKKIFCILVIPFL